MNALWNDNKQYPSTILMSSNVYVQFVATVLLLLAIYMQVLKYLSMIYRKQHRCARQQKKIDKKHEAVNIPPAS